MVKVYEQIQDGDSAAIEVIRDIKKHLENLSPLAKETFLSQIINYVNNENNYRISK